MTKKVHIEKDQFASIEDKDLRCRNIAVMILNFWEDHGEEVSMEYAIQNVTQKDEAHVRGWVLKLAKERGYEFASEDS